MKLLRQGFPRPCSILGTGSRFKIDSPKSEVMKIICPRNRRDHDYELGLLFGEGGLTSWYVIKRIKLCRTLNIRGMNNFNACIR